VLPGWTYKTAQELLRHANSRITLEIYTRAISSTKREANDKVMQMFLDAGQTQTSAPSPAPSGSASEAALRSSTMTLEAEAAVHLPGSFRPENAVDLQNVGVL
jgi:hypothetical protein